MLSEQAARDRAVRYAIDTGKMADMHLIHQVQRFEGNEPCFGSAESECTQIHCRWFESCMALVTYIPSPKTPCIPRKPDRRRKSHIRIARTPPAKSALRGLPRHDEAAEPLHSPRQLAR